MKSIVFACVHIPLESRYLPEVQIQRVLNKMQAIGVGS